MRRLLFFRYALAEAKRSHRHKCLILSPGVPVFMLRMFEAHRRHKAIIAARDNSQCTSISSDGRTPTALGGGLGGGTAARRSRTGLSGPEAWLR